MSDSRMYCFSAIARGVAGEEVRWTFEDMSCTQGTVGLIEGWKWMLAAQIGMDKLSVISVTKFCLDNIIKSVTVTDFM